MFSEVVEQFLDKQRPDDFAQIDYARSVRFNINLVLFFLFFSFIYFSSFWLVALSSTTFSIESVIVYVGLILGLIYSRYRVFKVHRGMKCGFGHFLLRSPVVFSFMRYAAITLGVAAIITIERVVSLAVAYQYVIVGAVFGIASLLLTISPWHLKEVRRAEPLKNEAIISSLEKISGEAGVDFPDIRVYKVSELMLANIFTFGFRHKTIAITDFLLSNLSDDEAVSLLAREIGGVANGYNFKILITRLVSMFITALFVAVAIEKDYMPGVHFYGTPLLLIFIASLILIIGWTVPASHFSKRKVLDEDRFSLAHTSFEPLAIGLLKYITTNFIPLSNLGRRKYSLGYRIRILEREAQTMQEQS